MGVFRVGKRDIGSRGRFVVAQSLFTVAAALSGAAQADSATASPEQDSPVFRGFQTSSVFQNAPPFPASYSGPGSFRSDQSLSHLITAYFGASITKLLQVYANGEVYYGRGISDMSGLGSEPNGDSIRAGAVLPKKPYLARAYVRYTHELSDATRPVTPGWDEVRKTEPTSSLQFKAGKFSPIDDFDRNRYANSARSQFLNWGLMVNTAWDLASDTRAYSDGAVFSLNFPTWAFRSGFFAVPTTANGPKLGSSFRTGRGDNYELELSPVPGGPVVRMLAYRNIAPMGIWRNAIAAAAPGTAPDISVDRRDGHKKYGYALNLEWPLADDGETGFFARHGWNDGRTEMWGFADAEKHFSIGMQISGVRWRRADDRIGLGWVRGGASSDHLDYLALGGRGLFVGDGAIQRAREYVFEAYYRYQLTKYVQLTPDYQRLINPGYNSARGPISIYGLRLRIHYG